MLTSFGLPEDLVNLLVGLEHAKSQNLFSPVVNVTEEILGRPATSAEEWAKENVSHFQ
jgi:hypothetical protein